MSTRLSSHVHTFRRAKSVMITSTKWGRTNVNVNNLPSVLGCAKEPAEPVLDEKSNNIAGTWMT